MAFRIEGGIYLDLHGYYCFLLRPALSVVSAQTVVTSLISTTRMYSIKRPGKEEIDYMACLVIDTRYGR